jgi:hypothetical protein
MSTYCLVVGPPSQPVITGTDLDLPMQPGSLVQLLCTAEAGNPPAILTWHHGAEILDSVVHHSDSHVVAEVEFYLLEGEEEDVEVSCESMNEAIEQPLRQVIQLKMSSTPALAEDLASESAVEDTEDYSSGDGDLLEDGARIEEAIMSSVHDELESNAVEAVPEAEEEEETSMDISSAAASSVEDEAVLVHLNELEAQLTEDEEEFGHEDNHKEALKYDIIATDDHSSEGDLADSDLGIDHHQSNEPDPLDPEADQFEALYPEADDDPHAMDSEAVVDLQTIDNKAADPQQNDLEDEIEEEEKEVGDLDLVDDLADLALMEQEPDNYTEELEEDLPEVAADLASLERSEHQALNMPPETTRRLSPKHGGAAGGAATVNRQMLTTTLEAVAFILLVNYSWGRSVRVI